MLWAWDCSKPSVPGVQQDLVLFSMLPGTTITARSSIVVSQREPGIAWREAPLNEVAGIAMHTEKHGELRHRKELTGEALLHGILEEPNSLPRSLLARAFKAA